MTSERRIAANRENAKKSTGPRTRNGKTRASRNAIRHGLDAAQFDQPGVRNEVERIAKMICGGHPGALLYDQAVIIAESQILLARVRMARIALIERMRKRVFELSSPLPAFPTQVRDDVACLCRALPEIFPLERYERRALSRRRRAIRRFNALLG